MSPHTQSTAHCTHTRERLSLDSMLVDEHSPQRQKRGESGGRRRATCLQESPAVYLLALLVEEEGGEVESFSIPSPNSKFGLCRLSSGGQMVGGGERESKPRDTKTDKIWSLKSERKMVHVGSLTYFSAVSPSKKYFSAVSPLISLLRRLRGPLCRSRLWRPLLCPSRLRRLPPGLSGPASGCC